MKLSIKLKIIISFSILSLIAIGFLSFTGYSNGKKMSYGMMESDLQHITDNFASIVLASVNSSSMGYLEGAVETAYEIVSLAENSFERGAVSVEDAKSEAGEKIVKHKLLEKGYFAVFDANGNILYKPSSVSLENASGRLSELINQKGGTGRVTIGGIEFFASVKYFEPWDWYITSVAPVEDAKMLIEAEDFKEYILSVKIGETGYGYILDNTGTLIVHPASQGKNIGDAKDSSGKLFIKEILKNKNGKIIYPWQNPGDKKARDKIVIYKHIPEMDWIVASGSYIEELEKPLAKMKTVMMIESPVILAVFIIVSYLLAGMITGPLLGFIKIFRVISDGDLTQKISVKSNDEIATVAEEFNLFVEKIRDAILSVKDTTDSVVSATNELSSTAEELSATADSQAGQIGEVASGMDEMTGSSNEVSSLVEATGVKAENALQVTEKGKTFIEETVTKITSIKSTTSGLADTIAKLSQSSEEIGSIMNVINDIADQTNLLALNAAIEAARAGEAGRGFAVVADEVRKLAERTQNATKEVGQIISSLQSETVQAGKGMRIAESSVDEGIESATNTRQVFDEIVGAAEMIHSGTDSVMSLVQRQTGATMNINSNLQGLASAVEQSSAAFAEVSHTVNDLQVQTENLLVMISKFKV
jgi:methyl-accepting chemotaxis protein